MQPFSTLTAIAAPLPLANVDTDRIIPAQFLTTISRTGLGRHLFHAMRYDETGAERPDFVLNREPYRRAGILIALENFGCGSSREHAPWALLDFGIRCVIAPGFADIFAGNCVKNGILPLPLPRADCERLIGDAALGEHARIIVDLETQTVVRPGGETIRFAIDPAMREALLSGVDEIDRTLALEAMITAFERRHDVAMPWILPLHA